MFMISMSCTVEHTMEKRVGDCTVEHTMEKRMGDCTMEKRTLEKRMEDCPLKITFPKDMPTGDVTNCPKEDVESNDPLKIVDTMIDNLEKHRQYFVDREVFPHRYQRLDLDGRYSEAFKKLLEMQIEQAEAIVSETISNQAK